jgi:hypothetical protein
MRKHVLRGSEPPVRRLLEAPRYRCIQCLALLLIEVISLVIEHEVENGTIWQSGLLVDD